MNEEVAMISATAAGIIAVIVFIIGLIVALAGTVTIPAGHVGVIDYFGVVEDRELSPGFYLKHPFAHIEIISAQTQQYEYKDIKGTLNKEGVEIIPDASVIWHVEPDKASDIYKTVRGDYFDILITPAFMGILRDEMKKWTTEAFYTGTATQIQDDTYTKLKENLGPRGVVVEAVWFRGSQLPSKVKDAIELKMTEKQNMERMDFTVQLQRKEAERLMIEANATARANTLVAQSVTPTLVAWEYNKVLGRLADNQNSVFIISGGAGGGSPIILPLEKK